MKKADPKISAVLMGATYAMGTVGVAIGLSTVNDHPPSLTVACLLAVGGAGFLSWIRHSIFHRSDAIRMGWDLGAKNSFQIEVGLANLAWSLLAFLSVVLDWGLVAEAASMLVFGFYLGSVALMVTFGPKDEAARRAWGPIIGMAIFATLLIVVGVQGMNAAG
jgi:hypothetical protein